MGPPCQAQRHPIPERGLREGGRRRGGPTQAANPGRRCCPVRFENSKGEAGNAEAQQLLGAGEGGERGAGTPSGDPRASAVGRGWCDSPI